MVVPANAVTPIISNVTHPQQAAPSCVVSSFGFNNCFGGGGVSLSYAPLRFGWDSPTRTEEEECIRMLIGTGNDDAYCLDDVNANSCGDGNGLLVQRNSNNNDNAVDEPAG